MSKFENKTGDALEHVIPNWIPKPDPDQCSCKGYQEKMNAWGWRGCVEKSDEIIEHLLNQSDELPLILRSIPRIAREFEAKRLLGKALRLSAPSQ